MSNAQSALGQLTRAGIQKAPFQKRVKKSKESGEAFFGHAGRKGQRGGSAPRGGGSVAVSPRRQSLGVPSVASPRKTARMRIAGTLAKRRGYRTPEHLQRDKLLHDPRTLSMMTAKSESKRHTESRRLVGIGGGFQRFLEQDTDPKTKQNIRVYQVSIIEEGLGNSKDKNYYSGEALTKAVHLFNGSKCYADHPDAIEEKALPERSMKDFVGWYSNCYADKNPNTGKTRLCGKLHFFPSASWLTEKIDTILQNPDAPKNLFGISINAVGKTRPADMDGEQVNYVEEFQRVDSADVVTEPAARGGFLKMLESKHGVNRNMRRTRESTVQMDPNELKEYADSLTSAHQSDNPDEMKDALYRVGKKLYAASSISGTGPGQVNEELGSNITSSTEGVKMQKSTKGRTRKVKASGPGGRMLRTKKRFQAAAGTGPDSEDLGEPGPDDIEDHLESRKGTREADVEDEEGDDLGAMEDFGDSSKQVKASGKKGRRVAAREDEGFEGDEDEAGADDEGGEEEYSGDPGMGLTDEGPMDDTGEGADDAGIDDDMSQNYGESEEDEGEEDEGEISHQAFATDESEEDESEEGEEDETLEAMRIRLPKRKMKASGGRLKKGKEARATIGAGQSGKAALPSHAIGDYDEDYSQGGEEDNGGVGKSYKIKTSRFAKNRAAHKVAMEANRRIEILEDRVSRLRESKKAALREADRYRGIIRHHNTIVNAKKLLESAVNEDMINESFAKTIEPKLYGLGHKAQVKEIRHYARLMEAMQDGVKANLVESVEGAGARGGFGSFTDQTADSDLLSGLESDGVPMKRSR